MKTRTVMLVALAVAVGIAIGLSVSCGGAPPQDQASPTPAPATAGQRGGQDQTGPYAVAADWPKPLSQLPSHKKWTWGAVQGIFAESPNRVYILMRGELPALEWPAEVLYPNVGPSISFPVSQTPFMVGAPVRPIAN